MLALLEAAEHETARLKAEMDSVIETNESVIATAVACEAWARQHGWRPPGEFAGPAMSPMFSGEEG